MITEDYVSFETAKLLKEKGFWENCPFSLSKLDEKTNDAEIVRCPTLQMAMKWLREKYNLHIGVLINYQYMPRKYEVHIMHTEKYEDFILNSGTNFNTNKEACEAAIKYCLEKLI